MLTAAQVLPPLTAEFESRVEPSHPGAAPRNFPWKLSRSADGKTLIDQGNKSLITDSAAQQAISLDHVKKEAIVCPLPPLSSAPPRLPGAPQAAPQIGAPSSVQDLGKQFIAGHEAEGKRYTFQPPKLPGVPAMPHLPTGMPAVPKPPAAPQPLGMPSPSHMQLPQAQAVEVWTSSKFHLPLLTKTNGSMGQQTATCKSLVPGEPSPSLFRIPPGYKVLHVPMPVQVPGAPI